MSKKRKRRKNLYQRAIENEKLQKASTIFLPVIFGLVILILWENEILHDWFNTDTFTLPLPSKIGGIVVDIAGKLFHNTIDTVLVALIGLVLGSLLGYLIAVIAAIFPKAGGGGLNVIGAFASIPVVALAPVLNNWTRDVSSEASIRSMVSKIIVVMLIAAANMCLNAYRGLKELKPYAIDMLSMYTSKKRMVLTKLMIPNSIPYVFVALKVSVPSSIMTAIVAEYFAEYITGVGRQIRENIVLAQYSTAWAYIATACLIGITAYAILMIVQAVVLKKYH